MSRINKLTTSFINITNALDKTKNQDEYNISYQCSTKRSWRVSSTSSGCGNTIIGNSCLPRPIPTRASRRI